MGKELISADLNTNIKIFNDNFASCDDIIRREMVLGKENPIKAYAVYIEISVDFPIGLLINEMWNMPGDKIYEYVMDKGLGIADISELQDMEMVEAALLGGNVILFLDGYDKAIKLSAKGYPSLGVTEAESEKVIRGSKEGFSDSAKTNTALIRKRIRSHGLKVLQVKIGVRSNTLAYIVYMEGIARKYVIDELKKRLGSFVVDGVFDVGTAKNLMEKSWYSPFPQFQTTERPDRAAQAILEGRVLLLMDNSPAGLILPASYNDFIKTSDDYYNFWGIVSFDRIIRYIATIISWILPGLYLAVTNFHTKILPTNMVLSFAAARAGVPFGAVIEIVLMELAFELLREAGVRLPGSMGNTIGIVGGLIIGQAAVEANIVSPIVVIVVALTALCSFAIPNEEFATAFRLIKFYLIVWGACLGIYGITLGFVTVLIHLSTLESFKFPYLSPFVGSDINEFQYERDFVVRWPARMLYKRPFVADEKNRFRLRLKNKQR